jgi:hypothetical protein
MERDEYLNPENWRGGPTYELAMAWPAGNDGQMLQAIRALWSASSINGPWQKREDFPGLSDPPRSLDRENGHESYGLLTLGNGTELPSFLFTVLAEAAASATEFDWLFLVIYRGAQERTFNFVYSENLRLDNPWFEQIDATYLAIAESVYAVSPFNFAILDHEGPAPFEETKNVIEVIQQYGSGCLLPVHRLPRPIPAGWNMRPSGLFWYLPHDV